MSKRRSDEARVLAYFTSAPLEKVELMLGLVRDQVKQRSQKAAPAQATRRPAKRKARGAEQAKAAQAAGSQTGFDPVLIEGGVQGGVR